MVTQKKILVVEDNALNRAMLVEILADRYTTLEAENGQVALDILRADPDSIALILLDVVMPVMDGYTFLEFFMDDDVDEENMSPALKVVTNKYFATAITLVLAYLLAKVGYAEIWPLFGSANQLLSVLALVACAVCFTTKTSGCI